MNNFIDDRDDDVRLPTRSAERHTAPRAEAVAHDDGDREFTLSTGTVLGIFIALTLICAVFFGFGYTMGRKSGQATAEAGAPAPSTASETAAAKPAPGAPVLQAIPGYLSQNEADTANRNSAAQVVKTPDVTTVVVPTPGKTTRTQSDEPPMATVVPVPRPAPVADKKPVEPRPLPAAASPVVLPAGTTGSYVQIAAVSHQEDAEVLLSALKRRGYSVFARPGDTDKLIHVQVGPFSSKKDADAMRQRLLSDGYNAIVK